MIEIKRFTEGYIGANTYLVWDEESREACVIDVGNPPDNVKKIAAANDLKVKYIILTHAHYDHVLFLKGFLDAFPGAVSAIHPKDDEILGDPRLNCSLLFGSEEEFPRCELMLNEGDELKLGETMLKILNTPGHTEGSICLLSEGKLFSGDTLFYDSFGRTDLGRGDIKEMGKSLSRLFELPEDTVVYPGHGTRTTIGREKRENPFFYMY